jgi:hypothetical protein
MGTHNRQNGDQVMTMTRSVALAGLMALTSSIALAQTPLPPAPPLATRLGHELNVSAQHYNYTEPPPVDISIHGPKFGGEYTGTFALGQRQRWFAQLNVRGTGAIARYDGNCRPWLIVPSSTSPNGYRLTLGTTSPCSETGDADWFAEGRALVGKDFSGRAVGVSPFVGIGIRHLSNGTTGNFNFRTDEYLYVPIGMTLRTAAVPNHTLAFSVEYDQLLRGWQHTNESLLTGGTVPATSTTPAFSIGDFADLAFEQHRGWALRASATYQINRAWSVEPYYVRWRIDSSPFADGSVAYTVNGITARQTFTYYEPLNYTNEAGVKVGLHFGGR